jgi:hypothetical protein
MLSYASHIVGGRNHRQIRRVDGLELVSSDYRLYQWRFRSTLLVTTKNKTFPPENEAEQVDAVMILRTISYGFRISRAY